MNYLFKTLLMNFLLYYSAADKKIQVYKDYLYIEQTQSYYKFHSPNTWTDAKEVCESECSSLWYPKNYNEAKSVISLLKEENHFDILYIGISDLKADGNFVTVDDIPIANVYNNWQLGQPDNFENEDCVVIAPGHVLNDAPCTDRHNFICKKNESCALELNKQCGGSHKDPYANRNVSEGRYIDTAQARYKFHSPRTWRDAKKTCEDDSSSFWYPKNKVEMHTVLSLFKETENFDWVYIGISDLETEGEFITTDGIPLEDVYNDWEFLQPDNYQEEDCVHISPNSLLNDVDCERAYSFICKENKSVQKYRAKCDIGNRKLEINKHDKDYSNRYEYIDETKAYYKLNSPSTWTDAKRKCDSDGSSLWYPKNYEEAHAVLSRFRETQNFSGLYIGISDTVVDGIYETIDGIPIADVYDNWKEDKPSELHEKKNCVHISPDAVLSGISCKKTYPFVCKKTKRNIQGNNKCDASDFDMTTNVENDYKDYKYIKKADAYFKYHHASKWSEAKRTCESDGSILWSPKNYEEVQAVLSRFGLIQNYGWLYLGITDLDLEGTFETIDGVPVSQIYNRWGINQPDNFKGAENCVHIASDGLLNDIDCWRTYPFVCKKTKSIKQDCSKDDNDNTLSKLGYTYSKEELKWYKFYKIAMNWTEAYKVCSAEQSYLAVINSNIERNYLLGLIRGSDYYVTQVIPKDTIHLGFHNRYGSGWQTIKGTKLDDSGYSRWAENQPGWLSVGKEETCGAMSYTGELYKVKCDTNSFFICEHDDDKQSLYNNNEQH